MSTLKDIAKYVGVSVSTVSRVINEDTSRHVNPETRKKIWQAVQELGYEPNQSARSLVQQKREKPKASMQVGCIVFAPQLRQHHPYFSPILSGVNKQLLDSGYTMAYIHSLEEVRSQPIPGKLLLETPVDGVIVVGEIDPPILDYIRRHVPVVGIDITSAGTDYPIVDYNRIAVGKTAVQHLISRGHRRIGFVGGETGQDGTPEEPRFTGYKYALMEAGLPLNPDWIVETEWKVDRSYGEMLAMLESQPENLPTAMLAASDMMAIAAMRAAAEKGLRIPEDIAFVGIDDIEIAEYTSPPLSSIHIPKFEIGTIAVNMLLDYIQGRQQMPLNIQVPHRLIVRQSSDYTRT
ncbi:hypothetical protein SD70_13065 [Gordoniibacillus kamchatkensis]|uniref:HTH lacI-type domain-containing protein n=1 Tax=Gordoniibacillus kamchatkensis TaxID=1590651 RepID=A0ABR5AIV5_9BACL|nr:LacI family DNA-binding transcriptional regulator [Paenibacillus sp. VKM B-2647]KIL40495.1 hypothetical protein SD70_13065 [Paenibacillus sp. VKM B-2647]